MARLIDELVGYFLYIVVSRNISYSLYSTFSPPYNSASNGGAKPSLPPFQGHIENGPRKWDTGDDGCQSKEPQR